MTIKTIHKIVACMLLGLISYAGQAQMQLYGLKHPVNYDPHQPAATDFNLISLDPFSGNSSVLLSIPNSNGVINSSSTYDHGRKRYIYIGSDDNQQSRIYHIDVDSAQMISSSLTTGYPAEIEYDLRYQKSYGLQFSGNGLLEFVEVNVQTGAIQVVNTLSGIQSLVIGTATYDSNAGRYFFIGQSHNGTMLYSIRASDGSILQQISLAALAGNLTGLEYDLVTNKLYALHYTPNSGSTALIEIDTQTGQWQNTLSSTTLQLAGVVLGGTAFDQNTQTYVVQGLSGSGYVIKLISVQQDSVIKILSMPAVIQELQVDNSIFAARYYQSNVTSSAYAAEVTNPLLLWPNPSRGRVQVEGLPLGTQQQWQLIDIQGRVLEQGQRQTSNLEQWDWSDWPAGQYFLRIRSDAKQWVLPLQLQ